MENQEGKKRVKEKPFFIVVSLCADLLRFHKKKKKESFFWGLKMRYVLGILGFVFEWLRFKGFFLHL